MAESYCFKRNHTLQKRCPKTTAILCPEGLENARCRKLDESQPILQKRVYARGRMIKTRFEPEPTFGYKTAVRNLFGCAALKTTRRPDGTKFRAYRTTCHRSL